MVNSCPLTLLDYTKVLLSAGCWQAGPCFETDWWSVIFLFNLIKLTVRLWILRNVIFIFGHLFLYTVLKSFSHFKDQFQALWTESLFAILTDCDKESHKWSYIYCLPPPMCSREIRIGSCKIDSQIMCGNVRAGWCEVVDRQQLCCSLVQVQKQNPDAHVVTENVICPLSLKK